MKKLLLAHTHTQNAALLTNLISGMAVMYWPDWWKDLRQTVVVVVGLLLEGMLGFICSGKEAAFTFNFIFTVAYFCKRYSWCSPDKCVSKSIFTLGASVHFRCILSALSKWLFLYTPITWENSIFMRIFTTTIKSLPAVMNHQNWF